MSDSSVPRNEMLSSPGSPPVSTGSACARAFSAFADQSANYLFAVSAEGLLLYANPSLLAAMGIRGSLDNTRAWQLPWYPPKARPLFEQAVQLAATGERVRHDNTYITAGGEERIVDESVYPLRGDDGRLQMICVEAVDVTVRRAMEESLRRSETLYRTMFNLASVGIAEVLGIERRVIRVNKHFCDILGYSESELLTMRVRDFTHPDDRDWDEAAYGREMKDAAVRYQMEKRYVRKDGRVIWAQVRGTVRRDSAGHPIGATAVVEDITDRKTAERLARVAEEQYRAIFNATRDGLIINATDGRVVEANPAACEMHGYTREEFLALKPHQFIHAEDLPHFAHFVQSTSKGQFFRCEARDIRKDGTLFPVEVLGTTVSYNGQTHLMGMVRDISDRRDMEARLRRLYRVAAALSEAMHLEDVARVAVDQGIAAVGAIAGSLVLLSPDGKTLRMIRAIGYRQDVVAPWSEFPIDAQLPLADSVRRGIPIFIESRQERLKHYPSLANASTMPDTVAIASIPLLVGSQAIGVLGLSFAQETLSAADREFMISLGQQCAQAIERARLFEAERESRAEAERANRAKDEFIAVLSHELRTPLTPVLLSVSLLESHPGLPPELQEEVRSIRRNVELESILISDLLDLTRITHGKMQLDLQNADLHALIRAAIDVCGREESAPLLVQLDASRHIVRADAARLQQVLWNLITNAQKFTPADGRITIRTSDLADGRIRIAITDTGEGIDPETLPRLFNAFEQGNLRTKRQFAGLGLGLAISKKLVDLQAGTISVHSAGKGQGATFHIEFPTVHAAAPSAAPPPTPPLAAAAASTSALRILLVEDHAETLRALSKLLQQCGHQVVGAASVAAAINAAAAQQFDLLLSDLGLPDGSGLDLMRELRPRYEGRSIALTGFGMEDDIRRSHAAGFAAHLTKPIDRDRLMQVIEAIVEKPE